MESIHGFPLRKTAEQLYILWLEFADKINLLFKISVAYTTLCLWVRYEYEYHIATQPIVLYKLMGYNNIYMWQMSFHSGMILVYSFGIMANCGGNLCLSFLFTCQILRKARSISLTQGNLWIRLYAIHPMQ